MAGPSWNQLVNGERSVPLTDAEMDEVMAQVNADRTPQHPLEPMPVGLGLQANKHSWGYGTPRNPNMPDYDLIERMNQILAEVDQPDITAYEAASAKFEAVENEFRQLKERAAERHKTTVRLEQAVERKEAEFKKVATQGALNANPDPAAMATVRQELASLKSELDTAKYEYQVLNDRDTRVQMTGKLRTAEDILKTEHRRYWGELRGNLLFRALSDAAPAFLLACEAATHDRGDGTPEAVFDSADILIKLRKLQTHVREHGRGALQYKVPTSHQQSRVADHNEREALNGRNVKLNPL